MGIVDSNRMAKAQEIAELFNPQGANPWLYFILSAILIMLFTYFYTSIIFNPVDLAENLKKQGGFVPGIKQGAKTAEYIDKVLTRITLGGSLYVAAVCIIPTIVQQYFRVPFYFGGTSIMIVVGVALDTVSQIEAHLITRNYEGLSGGGGRATRVRGRRDVG